MYSKQVARQLHPPIYTGRRELDFTPFEDALAAMSAARAVGLDAEIPQSGVMELQRRLVQGELTSHELVVYFVRRIRQHTPLNALGELNPDALEIADQLDAEARTGLRRGPLHGIPVLLKDNIATGDRMHTTAGAKAMENASSPRDSFVARRLRAAGAILLGKANLSEWANFMSSGSANGFSVLGGQVRNPYGKFDVSGSSSGCASALAAGLVPLAVGTETCGSLIAPGSANSLAVLKPSLGLVSRSLVVPITAVTDTPGPMARTVSDLALLMHALAGPDPDDPATQGSETVCKVDCSEFLDSSALRGMRIGWVTNLQIPPPDRALVQKARAVLEGCGAVVVDLALRKHVSWDDIIAVFCYGMQHDLNRYLQAVQGYGAPGSLAEVISFNAADPSNRAPYGQEMLERSSASPLTPVQHAALAEKIIRVSAGELRRLRQAGEVDLLISLDNSLAGYYAIAGFPALTVPLGYRAGGAPVGLTFTGERFEDGKLIAAAFAFEQAAAARVVPSLSSRAIL